MRREAPVPLTGKVRLVTFNVPTGLLDTMGETETTRATVPENPLRPVTVIVEAAEEPLRMVSEPGLLDRVKSGGNGLTVSGMEAGCDREPLIALTIIV